MFKKLKISFYYAFFYIRQFLDRFFTHLFFKEIYFFFLFLFHRYSPKQFNPKSVKENYRVLIQMRPKDRIKATKEGTLILLTDKAAKTRFHLFNNLLFGAPQARVEKTVFFTFLTLTLELYNPFDRKLLKIFLEKKMALLKRLLKTIDKVNEKEWDKSAIFEHIEIFHRSSLLQDKIIHDMQEAVLHQKIPKVVKEGQAGLDKGLYPLLIAQGCSGTYWIRGPTRKILGIFKPFDEELMAPNNPVGPKYQGALGKRKSRSGVRVGETPHREVAAFMIDKFFGFGIVPHTYYASFTHSSFFIVHEDPLASRRSLKTKYGSFQEFAEGFTPATTLSHEERQAISFEEFQLLVVLDVIIGNLDRNMGNILIAENKIAAVDHGLSFPDIVDFFSLWYWKYFDHGEKPLHPAFLELLKNFPFEEMQHKLSKYYISYPALMRMQERIVLFREGSIAGLPINKLVDLMHPEYLWPLLDRKETLTKCAQDQVKLFLEKSPKDHE